MQNARTSNMGSTYGCGYRFQYMLKLWACRFFYHASCCAIISTFSVFDPKYPRTCAMFWMTAYQNCPPLCFATIYHNLTPSILFFLFFLFTRIDTCFLSLWHENFSIFQFSLRKSRICISRSRIIGYINLSKEFLFIERKM